MPFAARQIEGRQKIKSKVPLFYASDKVLYPQKLSLEQASSELTARYKSSLCHGDLLIDLTGGLGIDSYFLSEQFQQCIYIEQNKDLFDIATYNFDALGKTNITVFCTDGVDFIRNYKQTADWIYLDPARRDKKGQKVVLISDCEPNILNIKDELLAKTNALMLKLSPMIDISSVIDALQHVSEVYIVAVENECKELLVVLKPAVRQDKIKIIAVDIDKNGNKQLFQSSHEEEATLTVEYARELKKYLYEPNAAIMKSGTFKQLALSYNIEKLHKNTHLYTSDELLPHFPGRIFEIEASWGNSKAVWKNELRKHPRANVSVRNYPASVNEIRQKFKIREGGELFLFACTLINEEKTILQCKKYR